MTPRAPGVGLVMVRSEQEGPVALGRTGDHFLASGRVIGTDPVGPVRAARGRESAPARRFSNTGDLIVIGPYDADHRRDRLLRGPGRVTRRSGGWQGQPFLLHPADLPIAQEPLAGAPAVNALLRLWLGSLQEASRCPRAGSPARPSSPTAGRPGPAGGPDRPAPRPVAPRAGRREHRERDPRGMTLPVRHRRNRAAVRVVSGTRPPRTRAAARRR